VYIMKLDARDAPQALLVICYLGPKRLDLSKLLARLNIRSSL